MSTPKLATILEEIDIVSSAVACLDDMEPEEAALARQRFDEYLEGLLAQTESKVEAIIEVGKRLDAQEAYLKERAAHYQARATSVANNREWMRGSVFAAMVRFNIPKLKCTMGTISRRATPPKVVINGDVPEAYTKTTITVEPDKAKIKDAIKAGEVLDFAELVSGETISIRG